MTSALFKLVSRVLAVLLVALALGQQTASAQSYLVSVDTSRIQSLAGFLDFQFNPSVATAPAAVVHVQFANVFDTVFTGSAAIEGNVVVASSAPLLDFSMGNSTAFNDLLQPVNFGSRLSFALNFTGDFLTASGADATAFSLTLLADDMISPLLTMDAFGTVATFDLQPGGPISISTFPVDLATPASVVQISPVPEAQQYTMLTIGLAVVGAWVRGRRGKSMQEGYSSPLSKIEGI